jgi:hypothetical protein
VNPIAVDCTRPRIRDEAVPYLIGIFGELNPVELAEPWSSKRHSSTFVAVAEKSAKLTPSPVQVAPNGCGTPSCRPPRMIAGISNGDVTAGFADRRCLLGVGVMRLNVFNWMSSSLGTNGRNPALVAEWRPFAPTGSLRTETQHWRYHRSSSARDLAVNVRKRRNAPILSRYQCKPPFRRT